MKGARMGSTSSTSAILLTILLVASCADEISAKRKFIHTILSSLNFHKIHSTLSRPREFPPGIIRHILCNLWIFSSWWYSYPRREASSLLRRAATRFCSYRVGPLTACASACAFKIFITHRDKWKVRTSVSILHYTPWYIMPCCALRNIYTARRRKTKKKKHQRRVLRWFF